MGHSRQPAPTNAPPQPAANQRLRPLKPLTIPNQVVGSKHSYFIHGPFAIGPAKIGVTVHGGAEFEHAMDVYDVGPGEPLHDIEILYHPHSKGQHSAQVTLTAAWSDGHNERDTTRVDASARELAEPPPDAITKYTVKQPDPDTALVDKAQAAVAGPVGAGDEAVTRKEAAQDFKSMGLLNNRLIYLFDERRTAIGDVKSQSEQYKPPEAPRSVWWDIAALALAIGTAGFGGVAGLAIETALKKVATANVAKFVSKVAEQSLARASAVGSDYLRHSTKMPSGDGISFFSEQSSALGQAQLDMADALVNGLGNVIAIAPSSTVKAAGDAMIDGINAMAANAKSAQASATSVQFVEYRARTSMGSVRSNGSQDAQVTSVMTEARIHGGTFPGLLELHVAARFPNRVTSAYVTGVAKPTAEHLRSVDLRTAGVPIRIHPNREGGVGVGVITRDEAGRIRYEGMKVTKGDKKVSVLDEDSQRGDPEAQAIRSAERMVNSALSKTLAEWGAPLSTDDQG